METIYQGPEQTGSLSVCKEGQFFIVKLSGKVSHESYKAVLEKFYEEIKVYNYRKVIFDVQSLTQTDIQSRAWYTVFFIPKFVKSYGTDFKTAVVKSKNSFENLGINFIAKVGETLGFKKNVQFFDDLPAAINWTCEKQYVEK